VERVAVKFGAAGLGALACLASVPGWAQEPTPGPTAEPITSLSRAAPPSEAHTLRFGNRPIVVLRARLLGRTPEDRARASVRRIRELAEANPTAPVAWHLVEGVAVVTVGGEGAIALLPADVDPVHGSLDGAAREARDNLRLALAEVDEGRSLARLARGALRALVATVVLTAIVFLLWWVRGHAVRQLTRVFESRFQPLDGGAIGSVWKTTGATLFGLASQAFRAAVILLGCVLAWIWLGYVLRQFPYTRPWGEAMDGFLVSTLRELFEGALAAVPGLFTVALIVALTRLAVRVVKALFLAVEQERLTLPIVHADTAQPTRRLIVALLWLFALVVAYPYLPGSGSDVFKGVSVFVGLMLSLGSSGLVHQLMSSFMLTYGRAFKVGDFVRLGDVEGTVVNLGPLATKVLTRRNEEITLPNAVITSGTIVNYSRHSGAGVFVRCAVTIGYDVPWRQVHALLLGAAKATPGVRADPPPRVLQAGLQNFSVEYALLVAPERPEDRMRVLSDLHAQIQDAFNEHGVQIMSPNYEADPERPKVVPKAKWFAPPAAPDPGA
jgi:small-conductance mechanosensitive channel